MSKTLEQLREEMDQKIPRDAVSQREGGGRSKLSYLEGWYVIDRLNKVIGQGHWAYDSALNMVHSGLSGDKHTVHYLAKVKLVVELAGVRTEFVDIGYGDGSDKYNIGKAHELAAKEAVTDGLKRCAKNLGNSFGLALYDKSQENVDDGNSNAPISTPAPGAKTPASGSSTKAVPPVEAKVPTSLAQEKTDRKTLNEAIAELSSTLLKKFEGKEKTEKLQQLRDVMKTKFGASTKEALTDDQASDFYKYLKGEVA